MSATVSLASSTADCCFRGFGFDFVVVTILFSCSVEGAGDFLAGKTLVTRASAPGGTVAVGESVGKTQNWASLGEILIDLAELPIAT
jgi:hypothetical protein